MEKNILILLLSLALLSSCDKERLTKNIDLETRKIELYHNETKNIVAKSKLPIDYNSLNGFHAEVDNNGMVKGMYVGETRIKVSNTSDEKFVDVKVKPRHYLYNEPDVSFGENKSSIIAKCGNPDNESDGGLTYLYEWASVNYVVLYLLDDNDNLYAYSVMIPSEYHSRLTDFISERYKFIYYSNSRYYYINSLDYDNATKVVATSQYNASYWTVLYMKKPQDKSFVDDVFKRIKL